MSGYIGTQPVPQATQTRDSFTATANQTSFATSGYTPEFLDVFLNGVKLAASDYTATNGSDVVLASGAAASDILEVVAYSTFEVLNPTFDGNVTFTGNASFGDNDKAIFGDGSDLQIYHDGTHSYVADAGGGSLVLSTNGSTVSINTDGPENMAIFRKDGSVDLFHNNSKKFETTATGIDVTGTVTADELNVSDAGKIGFNTTGSYTLNSVPSPDYGLGYTVSTNPINLSGYYGISFATNRAERMRIDSSGNVLVGKTTTALATAGITLGESGFGSFTRSGYEPLNVNRLSSDGAIAKFYKDGTTVGSIATQGSRLSIGSGDVNLNFNASANSMYPISDPAAGTLSSGIVDLGAALATFKDAYLSGGIYLGGTGSANKLDDYERGTWTPTVSSGTISISTGSAVYIKIGNSVTCWCRIKNFSDTSSSTHFRLQSLPFNKQSFDANIGHAWGNGMGSYRTFSFYGSNSSNVTDAYAGSANVVGYGPVYHDTFSSGTEMLIRLHYETA